MADDQDPDSKTEQPTQRRLEEALKKGNIPYSKEISNFFVLALLALLIGGFAPGILRNTKILLMPFLEQANALPTDKNGLGELLQRVLFAAMALVVAPMLGAMIAAIASGLMQNGFVLSGEPIQPKLERISPLSGLKRMFSLRSVMELVKGIIKITIVGYVAFMAVYPELKHIHQLPNSNTEALLIYMSNLAVRMTIGVAIAMFFIALLDLLYQRFQYTKSLRMTQQEIKDEYKQSEGDPMIKQRLRRLRAERARNRMMSAVPTADVVITNPTHFAVALSYDTATMKAPTVVAKGQDLIALKIREVAEENNVPIVENPPLARALFASSELDEEIPITHYEAVAKVISYVYQLKGKKFN
jgi:flagellar biosynthetic protein FlhB